MGAGWPSPTTLYSYGNGNRGVRLTYALFANIYKYFLKLFVDGAVYIKQETSRFVISRCFTVLMQLRSFDIIFRFLFQESRE